MALINIDHRDKKEQRKFGLVVGGLFLILGIVRFLLHGVCLSAQIFWGIGLALIVLGLLLPIILMPLLFIWIRVAEGLNWIITHLLLLIVFYFVLTPIGILYRLFVDDPLNRKWEPHRESYWEEVEVQPQNIDEFKKQF